MLKNPEVQKYFEPLSAHSDIATDFFAALKPLGEYECRGGSQEYAAPYAMTKDTAFCGAAGVSETYWRLRSADRQIALATGAQPSNLGADWVKIVSFRADWPKPDLQHWALRAYDFARIGK